MGNSLGCSVTIKACAAALVLSLPVAGGVAWADGADGVATSGKAAAFAAESGGVLSEAELNELGVVAASNEETVVSWGTWGTCEWTLNPAGDLVVRPANGAAEGYLYGGLVTGAFGNPPWKKSGFASFKSVRFEGTCHVVPGGVKGSTSLNQWFSNCASLETVDLSGLDTFEVTDMSWMFYDCPKLSSIDFSGFDTSAVTNVFRMFWKCPSLTSLDLSSFDTSAVTSMSYMFADCPGLSSLDLSSFDTSKTSSMHMMFYGCSSLTSLDLSGFDTSNVEVMSSMFDGCSNLSTVSLASWDISSVLDMKCMFAGCSGLSSLDLSAWDTSAVQEMQLMFKGCLSLRAVTVGDKFAFKDFLGYGDPIPCVLPTPSGDGLTGKWVSSADGKAYAASEIPNNVAATYTAERTAAPDPTPTPDPEPEPTPESTLDPVQTFPDVDYSQWYADGVTFCSEKGLITGYTTGEDAGKFGVGRTLTRAQLAAILWRNAEPEAAEAYDSDAANVTGMSDVADNEWYTGAANWAVKAKVINGSDKGDHREFRPNDPVTAEQLAAILANYADPAGAENADLGVLDGFADSGDISDWARGSAAWAKSKSIINGYDEGGVRLLKPYEKIARERVATILMNAFEGGVLK